MKYDISVLLAVFRYILPVLGFVVNFGIYG